MASTQYKRSSSWSSKSTSSSDFQVHIRGVPFTLDRDLLAAKSAKLAVILKENPHEDLSYTLRDIPADPETFELVARFCHGFELDVSTDNVVPLSCLAHCLEMTEKHSTNNLLKKALTVFEQRILPSWNECIKALRTIENIRQQAVKFGLVDACVESIITKAQANPLLLGEPIKKFTSNDDTEDNENDDYMPNVRRRLFVLDWQSEDLTTLSLWLYEAIISAMYQRKVPLEYLAASLCQYAKRWVFSSNTGEDDISIYKRNSQREVIETVERLLPGEKGLLPCTLLFEMLRFATALEASSGCRNGFETRIGKQLDQATVKDLLIPSQGYAKEMQYDTECVRRILKNFYCHYTRQDASGLIMVAELVDEFLAEVASDIDLKMSTFLSLAEMSVSASAGTQRNSDGIYRAIDIYLDKHRYLTESEREEVCQVLDCHKLSPEACEHAAQNDRLPLRMVVQILFVGQLQLRDTIVKEVQGSDDRLRKLEEEEAAEEEEEEKRAKIGCGEEEMRVEMEKMSNKVIELESECHEMRRKIQSDCSSRVEKEKGSMWKEMKRKFGCISSSMHDCNNCHVKKKKKKVHPR
ncbi:BTB/POZ domain-containing protein At5g17580 [Cornus florida]|uniref:BTB/POZ domain-containing protein At5g17580 n=1 Tax=Cornus florida TaxID=4283 RepID=UPI0028A0776E|nr:BTB/POZ domain-containing protein At5g17580 [Cornus florida]